MNTYRSNTDLALLLMRLFFGFAMIYAHGWGKMTRLLSGEPIEFADPFGLGPAASLALAAFAEVICAALVMVGLFTRLAVIPLIITMLVAVSLNLGKPFVDLEKALVFLCFFAALQISGPGAYSLDARMPRRVIS